MLFGVMEKAADGRVDERRLRAAAARHPAGAPQHVFVDGPVGLCSSSAVSIPAPADLVVAGSRALLRDPAGGSVPAARRLADLHGRLGDRFPEGLRGAFALALWNRPARRLLLARDHLGVETVFVLDGAERLVFGTSIQPILAYAGRAPEINPEVLVRTLLFNYNAAEQSMFRDVSKLRPGTALMVEDGSVRRTRYWQPRFETPAVADEAEVSAELLTRLRQAVWDQVDPEEPCGVFLSGGMDSSTVAALARDMTAAPLQSFSYRCRSESFDESHYAQLMAKECGFEHKMVEYAAASTLEIAALAQHMEEPFSDVGINIGTYLLGKAAAGRVPYVLTGDGGDELFAGHPVYEADQVARILDRIPGPLLRPLLALGSRLPDSDRKKNLTVKLKRFSESLRMPAGLLSNRWRIYYDPAELDDLLQPDFAGDDLWARAVAPVLAYAQEGREAPGPLAQTLYADYQTVVDFYLRRNDLVRHLGLEIRLPLLDPDLVQFCAGLPRRLRIRGWFDTKYILKQAVEGVVPHAIVHRTDKLGHSIPMKNWMRDEPAVQQFVQDCLGPEGIGRRPWFRPGAIQTLLAEHLARRRNNSHRLWTLVVLELWLRAHVDGYRPL